MSTVVAIASHQEVSLLSALTLVGCKWPHSICESRCHVGKAPLDGELARYSVTHVLRGVQEVVRNFKGVESSVGCGCLVVVNDNFQLAISVDIRYLSAVGMLDSVINDDSADQLATAAHYIESKLLVPELSSEYLKCGWLVIQLLHCEEHIRAFRDNMFSPLLVTCESSAWILEPQKLSIALLPISSGSQKI